MEDSLVIGYDNSNGKDHTCLVVGRKSGRGIIITNEFFDEEAEEIYNKLTNKERNCTSCNREHSCDVKNKLGIRKYCMFHEKRSVNK